MNKVNSFFNAFGLNKSGVPNFVGRNSELKFLESLYKNPGYSGLLVYGRRQVGKSTLLLKFIKDKPAIYFQANTLDDTDKIYENIYQQVLQYIHNFIISAEQQKILLLLNSAETLAGLFELIFAMTLKYKLVFVLDEFSYLLQKIPNISTLLQEYIDVVKRENGNLFLILCGSAIDTMRSVTIESAPLYGRLYERQIFPVSFDTALFWLKNYNIQDAFAVYSITDGLPGYLQIASGYSNLSDFLTNAFLTSDAILRSSFKRSVSIEHLDLNSAKLIVSIIYDGITNYNKILQKSHLSYDLFVDTFQKLLSLGIIVEKTPLYTFSESNIYYYVEDNLMLFWSTVLNISSSLLNSPYNIGSGAINEEVLHTYLGYTFEKICKDYLLYKFLNNTADNIGFWRENVKMPNNNKFSTEEIDILIVANKTLHLAECKYQNRIVDSAVLQKLIDRSSFVNSNLRRELYLFSRSGFTKGLLAQAQTMNNIHLITIEDMYNDFLKWSQPSLTGLTDLF